MPLLRNTTLGIDFGTSTSAVAVRQAGQPARLLALEGAATGLPTALFFNTENPQDQRTHFGRDAIEQYGPCPIHRHSFEPIKSLVGFHYDR